MALNKRNRPMVKQHIPRTHHNLKHINLFMAKHLNNPINNHSMENIRKRHIRTRKHNRRNVIRSLGLGRDRRINPHTPKHKCLRFNNNDLPNPRLKHNQPTAKLPRLLPLKQYKLSRNKPHKLNRPRNMDIHRQHFRRRAHNLQHNTQQHPPLQRNRPV